MRVDRAELRVFGPAARPLLGLLHRPTTATIRRDAGLVLCKPFGYESICAHRSLRHFAAAAAATGIPALRFDYDGTGDSAGSDRDSGRWDAWVASVHAAVEALRTAEGVDRVFLFGVRLGATLAAAAAAQRTDVAGLVAVVPVLSGRAWLRETQALELAMRFAGPPPGLELPEGDAESVGFVITQATKAALLGVDLLKIARPPAREMLVIDRDDLPSNTKWVQQLSELGAVVDHRRLPGYADMMRDPHQAAVPEAMLDAVIEWLDRRTTARATAPVAHERVDATGPMVVAPGVEESATYFGSQGNLFGVMSTPSGVPRPSRAILLLNAGAITHIGPSRLYVDLARRWAARGYMVFRFDQAGIGDSLPFQGEPENVVYASSALEGVREAVSFLRERLGVREFQALGLCSGAYHAFKAAVAGLPFSAIAVVNPLVFFWKPGMSLAYPQYQVAEAAARYKRAILTAEKWKKLLTGKASVRDFVQVVARRTSQQVGAFARNVARAIGQPFPEDLGTELDALVGRGVQVRFVFATGDPGEDLLKSQAGWAFRRLERANVLRVSRIEGPNHAFTPVWTRTALTEVLESELEVR